MQNTEATLLIPAYFGHYKNLAFKRDGDGVLLLRFHTDGGPVVFTGRTHEESPAALEDIALDHDSSLAMALEGLTGADLPYQDEA